VANTAMPIKSLVPNVLSAMCFDDCAKEKAPGGEWLSGDRGCEYHLPQRGVRAGNIPMLAEVEFCGR
jgi:hypothetical protein